MGCSKPRLNKRLTLTFSGTSNQYISLEKARRAITDRYTGRDGGRVASVTFLPAGNVVCWQFQPSTHPFAQPAAPYTLADILSATLSLGGLLLPRHECGKLLLVIMTHAVGHEKEAIIVHAKRGPPHPQ